MYSIQLVSNMTGVGVHTLRAWEKRYSAVVPKRNESGRRVYSEDEVLKISLLSKLTQSGANIRDIANLKIDDLQEKLAKVGDYTLESQSGVSGKSSESLIKERLRNLILGTRSYKLDIISRELSKVREELNVEQLVFEIITPLLSEVSLKVRRGDISIGQESALKSLVKFHLGQILYSPKVRISKMNKRKETFLFVGLDSVHDDFYILLCAVLCRARGYQLYYLGTDLSAGAISESMEALEITHVCTEIEDFDSDQTNQVKVQLKRIIERLDDGQKLILGGNAYVELNEETSKKALYLPTISHFQGFLNQLNNA